jgi:thiamine biosynthesis lipoprotein
MSEESQVLANIVCKQFKKFGTDIDFQIVLGGGESVIQAQKDLAEMKDLLEVFENTFSRFDTKSELMHFNAHLGFKITPSEHFAKIAKLALNYYHQTGGYFDPRIITNLEKSGYNVDFALISSKSNTDIQKNTVLFEKDLTEDIVFFDKELVFKQRMDFTGIVKGFVVDYVSTELFARGWKNFLIDCGGDMFFAGNDKNGNPWYIDIDGISYNSMMLVLSEVGIATSGISKRKWEVEGKRFHHIVNPKNPEKYSFEVKSVTVVADSTCEADVWAKTLFIMGRQEAMQFAKEHDIAVVLLDYAGKAWVSSELKKYLLKKDV